MKSLQEILVKTLKPEKRKENRNILTTLKRAKGLFEQDKS